MEKDRDSCLHKSRAKGHEDHAFEANFQMETSIHNVV